MTISLKERYEQNIKRFKKKQKKHPQSIRVLAEGDSWFTHPNTFIKGKSLINYLNEYKTVNIVSMASPGDLLNKYSYPPNIDWKYATNQDWLKGDKYDIVLISGGGNDILGSDFEDFVYKKESNEDRYGKHLINKEKYKMVMNSIEKAVSDIRNTVDDYIGDNVYIAMHGYGYAYPSGKAYELLGGLIRFGPWLQHSLSDLGIDSRDEQVEIINELVDIFNEELRSFEESIENFKYINLRDVLGQNDWDDEMHPNAGGRRALAKKIRQDLVKIK